MNIYMFKYICICYIYICMYTYIVHEYVVDQRKVLPFYYYFCILVYVCIYI